MERQCLSKIIDDSDSVYSDDEVKPNPKHAILNKEDVNTFLELEAAVANSIYQCVQLIRQRHTSSEEHSIGETKSFERLYETKAKLLNLYHLYEGLVHHDALTSAASFQNVKALHAEEEALLVDFHALHELVWKGHFMESSELSELEDLFEQDLPWLGALQQKSRQHGFTTEAGEDDRGTCRRPSDHLHATLKILKLRVYLKSKSDDLLARATDHFQIESAQRSPHNNESILEELQRSYKLLTAKHAVLRLNPKYGLSKYASSESCKDKSCRKQQVSLVKQAKHLQPQYEQAAKNAEENHKLREALLIMRKDRDTAIIQNSTILQTPPTERSERPRSQGGDTTQALADYYSSEIYRLSASEQYRGIVVDDPPKHTDFQTQRRSLVRRIHQAGNTKNVEEERRLEFSIADALQSINATKPRPSSPQRTLQSRADKIAHEEQRQKLDVAEFTQTIKVEKQRPSPLPKTYQTQTAKAVADEERLRELSVSKAPQSTKLEVKKQRPHLPPSIPQIRTAEVAADKGRFQGPAVGKAVQVTDTGVKKQRSYLPPNMPQIEAVSVSPGEGRPQGPTASKVTQAIGVQKQNSESSLMLRQTQTVSEPSSKIEMFKKQPTPPPHITQTGAARKPSSKIAMIQKKLENASFNPSTLPAPLKGQKVAELVKTPLQDNGCQRPGLPRSMSRMHPKISSPVKAENEHINTILSSSSRAVLTASPEELPESGLAEDLKSRGPVLSSQNLVNRHFEEVRAGNRTPAVLSPYLTNNRPIDMPRPSSHGVSRALLSHPPRGGLVESQTLSFPALKARKSSNEIPEAEGVGHRVQNFQLPYPTLNERPPVTSSPASSNTLVPSLLEDRVVEDTESIPSALKFQDLRNGSPGLMRNISRPARSLFPNREGHGTPERNGYSSRFQDSRSSSPALSQIQSSSPSVLDFSATPGPYQPAQRTGEPAVKEEDIATMSETLQKSSKENKRSSSATARFGLPYPVYSDEDFDNIPTNVIKKYENTSFGQESTVTSDDDTYHTYLRKDIEGQKATDTDDFMLEVSSGLKESDPPPIELDADKLSESGRNPGVWVKLKGKWGNKKNGAGSTKE